MVSDYAGRDWNLATAMVIKGDALVQVMGDWAKASSGRPTRKPVRTSSATVSLHDGAVIYNTDMFAIFSVPADRKAAQNRHGRCGHEQELPIRV